MTKYDIDAFEARRVARETRQKIDAPTEDDDTVELLTKYGDVVQNCSIYDIAEELRALVRHVFTEIDGTDEDLYHNLSDDYVMLERLIDVIAPTWLSPPRSIGDIKRMSSKS